MSIQQMQSKLSYSTDELVDASKKHVQFLRDLHKNGTTMASASSLRHSLVRYKDLWLPLVASYHHQHSDSADDDETVPRQEKTTTLFPPPDVAWLWHCHRLAPSHYENYVKKMFAGKLLEATPPFCFQEAFDEHDKTQRAWKGKYPDDPFFLEPVKDCEGPSYPEIVSPDRDQDYVGNHDVITSAMTQAAFLWQFSGPSYADDAFLHEGVRRYILFLRMTDHTLQLVATYQIDLMWHTHMLLSIDKYNQDCIRIRGNKFHHDDSLNDRTPGSNLEHAYKATLQLWDSKYKEEEGCFPVEGGMYRGEPPASFWSRSWVPLTTTTSSSSGGNASKGAATTVGASSGRRPQRIDFLVATHWTEPPIQGYVFGYGRQGVGHYSLDERSLYIRQAYKILLLRLNMRIQCQRSEMNHIACYSGRGCCGGTMKAADQRRYDAFQNEVDDMLKMKWNIEFALKHKGTTPPAASLKLAHQGSTAIPDFGNNTSSEAHCWYSNYAIAAGCGGIIGAGSSGGGGGGGGDGGGGGGGGGGGCGGCGGCGG